MIKRKKLLKKGMTICLAAAMVFSGVVMPVGMKNDVSVVYAAETVINSMDYYSSNDGPVITGSGVGEASYGFVMPIFNGGEAGWNDVSADLGVRVKKNDAYVDIDEAGSFIYDQNWGHWNDGGFTGYWFKVSETTQLQLYSKATGVTLDYTLEFTNIDTTTITSMAATDGPELTAGPTGSIGFTYPIFNGDSSIPYEAVAKDLKVYVKTIESTEWIDIDNNAASGWIYDKNFGQFTDGPGGYWFTLTESINVKLESKSSGVNLIYTLNYNKAEKTSYKLSSYDGKTTFEADKSGAIGIPLPKIGGLDAYESDLENYVYEIKINGSWVELSDYSRSTFSYSGNGYNKMSDRNQWGYWVDHIYGLWFQPIQQDYEIRIGYPENGEKGGAINDNYVYYNFIGNPDAVRPVMPKDDFAVGDPDTTAIQGWELVFNDEFSGDSLDTGTWNYVTGYYINDDPGTWGWGNNELEHYMDSEKNVYVADGKLNITAYEEPKSFPQDPNRYAQYSSGKITTQNKFAFKYGRIDFRAKLPEGNGLWPALWLLPNDEAYGVWAASGEIDVMEARGRLTGASSGAIHFGGSWPANTYIGGDYAFPDGQRIDTDYHLYSLVWEEDMLKWYVDGNLFFYANSDQWYTTASNAKGAPFDQEFYIIMNLAVGGWFDGGITPNAGDIPATMQVDYVRVYRAEGDTKATSSGGNGGIVEKPESGETEESSSENTTIKDHVGNDTVGFNRTNGTLEFYVNGATFADLHYKVNDGGQINVGMKNAGNGNFTYEVSDLNIGDTISYSFTYNPENGALDTEWKSYVLTAESGENSETEESLGSEEETQDEDSTIKDIVGDDTVGFNRTNGTLEFYVNGATFADLHYKVNDGGQINVGMKNAGNGNFTYEVSDLNIGDTISYSFTYNPENGALDTEWKTYVLTS